jgi:hypothetical protein
MIHVEEIKRLLDDFAESVAMQTVAIARGDSDAGNKFAARYIAAFTSLRACGDAGRDALSQLFTHSNADVRTTAAAFLLRHAPERARSILETEAVGVGIIAFEASEALTRWDEGDWELDPTD